MHENRRPLSVDETVVVRERAMYASKALMFRCHTSTAPSVSLSPAFRPSLLQEPCPSMHD